MPAMETLGCCWVSQGEQSAQLPLRLAVGKGSVHQCQQYTVTHSWDPLGKPDSTMFKSMSAVESRFECLGIITHQLCDLGQLSSVLVFSSEKWDDDSTYFIGNCHVRSWHMKAPSTIRVLVIKLFILKPWKE